MSGKGALGWLILMVALAVPAFMFWNWWKLLNNKPREGSRPAQGPVFEKTQMASNFQNPLTGPGQQAANPPAVDASSGAATGAPAQPGAPAPGPAPADPNPSGPGTANAAETPAPPPGATPAVPPAAPPDGALAQAPTPPADPAAPPLGAPPAAALAEPGLRYQPKVHRDPMLSPMDIKKLAEIALEEEDRKRREQDELDRLKRKPTRVVKVAAPPIESLVNLYGITAVPGSITAIVEVSGGDAQVVRPGDRLSNGVRIMKITQTTVYFQYRAKKWERTISK